MTLSYVKRLQWSHFKIDHNISIYNLHSIRYTNSQNSAAKGKESNLIFMSLSPLIIPNVKTSVHII